MKKIIFVMILTLSFISGCGKKETTTEVTTQAATDNKTTEANTEATTEATIEATTEATTEVVTEAEKEMTLDAIATYLLDGGYISGEQSPSMYSYIGAIGGFKYPDSDVELYEYDTSTDTYAEIVNSKTVNGLKVSAVNGPFVLIFSNGNENQDVINAFNDY